MSESLTPTPTQPVSGTITANAGTNLNTSALALDATLTGGTQQSKITDGTNIASVVAGDAGFNGQAVTSGTKTYTFTTSSSGVQTLLANTSCEGYSTIEVVYTSVGSGLALTVPFSTASGGTYVATNTWMSGNGTGTSIGTSNATIYFSGIHGNYFQIAVSALTSGTFTGTVILRNTPLPATGVNATQQGTWNSRTQDGSGNAITSNSTTYTAKFGFDNNLLGTLGTAFSTPGKVDAIGTKTNNNAAPGATNVGSLPAIANAAVPTWTEGNQVSQSVDLSGNQRITLGTLLAGEDLTVNVMKVEQRFSYSNITTATTTTIKSGTGFLHSMTINTPVASATITIYDNTSAATPKIGTVTLGGTLANDVYGSYTFDVSFTTGLTVVTSGATDLTFSYR